MKCPRCSANKDRVVDSRESAEGSVIRRRRECLACFLRFTTYERIETTPLRVVKKNGERMRFDRERILAGMERACEKLQVESELLEDATARIEAHCQEEYDREVPSAVIGNLVMEELKGIHHVAYVRYASVYREFKDAAQFLDELRPILESGGPADLRGVSESGSRRGKSRRGRSSSGDSTEADAATGGEAQGRGNNGGLRVTRGGSSSEVDPTGAAQDVTGGGGGADDSGSPSSDATTGREL